MGSMKSLILIDNLFILNNYTDFLIYNSKIYLFSDDKKVFYFDLINIYFNYIFYKLYKFRYKV